MVPAHAVCSGDEHLQRGITGTCPHASQACIDAVAALFHSHNGIGHAQAQVVVGVHAGLCFWLEHILEGAKAITHILHPQSPAGVHDIADGCPIAFHQLGLLCQPLRSLHMAHHQKAHGFHAQVPGILNMLARDIGLSAVSCHTHYTHTGIVGSFQIMNSANARQQQRCELGMLDHAGNRLNPFQIRMSTKAIVEAGALQTVPMRNFDGVHSGFIKCSGNLLDLINAVLMADGMTAISQSDVGNIKFLVRVHSRLSQADACSAASMRAAMCSAVRRPALVMMSRFPA